MRVRGDYRTRMTLSQFNDEDLDLLLRGEPRSAELERLVPFVAALRAQADDQPGPGLTELTAVRAAAVARSQASTARTVSQLRQGRASTWHRLRARSTVALGTVMALAAFSGVGLAADSASPGDLLYGIDLALEEIGIGDGSTEERLDEASVLVARGDLAGAVELLADVLSQADPNGDAAATAAAIEELEELSSDLDAGSEAASGAQEKVSDLLDFIVANAGKGNGLDGKEFGQGVAEIAKGETADGDEPAAGDPGDSEPTNAPGNSENSNAGGNGDANGTDGSGEPPGSSSGQSSGDDGAPTEPPGNSGNSNAGGNGNGNNGSTEPPANSGSSNAGGNGNGKP